MFNLKIESYLKFIFIISLVSIISAYFIEYILGHQPCNLCLIERIPYGLTIILIITNYMLKKDEKFIILLLIIIFIFSFSISFYHFGIEQGFFNESLVCELSKIGNNMSTNELLKELENKTISCKDVDFRVLGFSLATINTLISVLISVIIIKILINYEKNK